jgi:hypothetical protein
VWVETVIYTLIGLAVIGILLGATKPKIDEMKDKIILEQTIDSLTKISNTIYEIQIAPGNKRILDLKITKGKFFVDATNNKIGWIVDTSYQYSELNKKVNVGSIQIETVQANPYRTTISANYSINLTFNNAEQYQEVESSPAPYKLSFENKGIPSNSNIAITNIQIS